MLSHGRLRKLWGILGAEMFIFQSCSSFFRWIVFYSKSEEAVGVADEIECVLRLRECSLRGVWDCVVDVELWVESASGVVVESLVENEESVRLISAIRMSSEARFSVGIVAVLA